MVVYLDDVVVFSENMEDHKKHSVGVFKALRDNQLYLKKSIILEPLGRWGMHLHGSCKD
jgi:hypothetical protein